MSWIGGSFEISDIEKKTLATAAYEISEVVRHNADLAEFPNMGANIMPIRIFTNQVQATREAAEKLGEDTENKWMRNYNIVIPFYATNKETQIEKKIFAQISEIQKKRTEYEKTHHVRFFKAALVSCEKCGSKINKSYIKDNDCCPVCGNNLRSKTTLDALGKYDEKINEKKKQLRKEQEKSAAKNGKVKYLVMYCEYIG